VENGVSSCGRAYIQLLEVPRLLLTFLTDCPLSAATPLWRNGPPEKPVLCNACGSRWRTKGTLSNYMPMHSGGFGGSVCPEGGAVPRGRKNSRKVFSEPRSHKRKEPSEGHQERASLRSHMRSLKAAGDDTISTSSLSSSVSGLDDAAFIPSSSAPPPDVAGCQLSFLLSVLDCCAVLLSGCRQFGLWDGGGRLLGSQCAFLR